MKTAVIPHFCRKIHVITLCGIIAFLLLASTPLRSREPVTLIILHTNDLHGCLLPIQNPAIAPPPEKVGGAAWLAAAIARERKEGQTIVVDSGDIAVGSALSNLYYGMPVIDFMNHCRFDAMTLGNHEFEWGIERLKALNVRARFPFICANLIDERTGSPPCYVKPYTIVKREGMKIGIIGLLTQQTYIYADPRVIRHLTFLSPEDCLRKSMASVRTQGVSVIIVLSHLGYDEDKTLAERVPGITCFIGGHTHTPMMKPEIVRGTVIAQAGKNGMNLGRLELKLERKTGRIIAFSGGLIPIITSRLEPDRDVEKILLPYQEPIKALINTVVGRAEKDILNEPVPGSQSTPLGNLACDAFRWSSGADMSLYKSDGMRSHLFRGEITKGTLYALIPFEQRVVTAELSGREIEALLEFAMESPFYTQVSGITLLYDQKRPRGRRVTVILDNGKELRNETLYRLATVDYLFYFYYRSGGFDVFSKKRSEGLLSREALEGFIKMTGKINPPEEGRVRVANQ